MLPYNLALQAEEEQRIRNDQAAIDATLDEATQMFYLGDAHGAFMDDPQYPENSDYWRGYSQGLRKAWLHKNANLKAMESYGGISESESEQ